MSNQVTKREILFYYESTYSIPNGDPFTGEQRYDEDTKKVLVSDVRIKRFIRDYLENQGNDIFVSDKAINTGAKSSEKIGAKTPPESGASARYKALCKKYEIGEEDFVKVLERVIDLRLFGGIITARGNSLSFTGPVQFALLNPSLNRVNLRMHQNTSVLVSSTENKQGAIGTTTIVPYSINQIHGWVNPYAADETLLKEADVIEMINALWKSINLANTRSKSNQNSLLLLSINYLANDDKLYGFDKSINIRPKNKIEEESMRSIEDLSFDFEKLIKLVNNDKIKEVEFYTEDEILKLQLSKISKLKFNPFNI